MLVTMSPVNWESVPALRRPLVVVALAGWFDAGEAATGAVEWMRERTETIPLATIDSEEYFDFQQQRPIVANIDGERTITWPDTLVEAIPGASPTHDLVVVHGVEPHLGWPGYVDALDDIIRVCRADLVVTLGSMAAGVPHTRPPRVTGSATDPDLATPLGLSQPTYEGVTGVIGVLHARLDQRAVPAISLRVATPHYLGGAANPLAARALLEHLGRVTGLDTGFAELDDEVGEWLERVGAAVEHDDDVNEYVVQLQEAYDREVEELASSVDLADELERFLRDRED